MTQFVEQNGWQPIRLGELCERIDYGFTASADFSVGEPRFLRITDIQNGRVDWDTVPGCKISEHEVVANELHDGDIVFARTGATTGKSFLIQEPPRAVFASYLIRLRLKSECDPEFLSLFFQGPEYWQQIRSQARGGAQPNFNASMLAALNVRLPPLAEQRRIAGRLREQLAEVAKARTAVQAQLAAAQALPAAALRAAFRNGDSESWPIARLGDYVTKVGSGITPLGGHAAYKSEGIPLIRSQNVHMNRFERTGLAFISDEQDEAMAGSRVEPSDVLLNITGASIGRVCVVPTELCPANVNQHVSIIRGDGSFDPMFLAYFLAMPDFQAFVMGSQAGATRQALTKAMIEEFEIPLPPLDEQRAIAARLAAELAEATQLQTSLSEKLAAINRLPAALLAQAFQGAGDAM